MLKPRYGLKPWYCGPLAAAAVLVAGQVAAADPGQHIDRYRSAHETQIVGQLDELVGRFHR
jgi:hypothetical protein